MSEMITFTFWTIDTATQLGWALVQASVIATAAYLLVALARTITPAARVRISLLGLLLMGVVPAAVLSLSDGWSWGQVFPVPAEPLKVVTKQRNEQPAEANLVAQTGEMTSWQQVSIRASELFVNRTPLAEEDAIESERGQPIQEQASIVPVALLGLVAASVLFGLSRLMAGYWQISRLRSAAIPIEDSRLSADLAECTKQLGVHAAVSVRETRSLGSAAVIGWRNPLLLLPVGWQAWTSQERQAVLSHELAHVKRSDFVSTAIGQLAVAFNFYHPLAHIVLQRLRLDQELAADALAAQVVGGQQRYVEILAGLALRQSKVRTPGPCQAFLPPRRMFVRRLEMLRNLPSTGPWMNRIYSAVAAFALVGVATLATGLRPHRLGAQELLQSGPLTSSSAGQAARGAAADSSVTRYLPAGLWEAVVCVDVQSAMASEGVQAILKQADLPEKFDIQGYEIRKDDVTEVAVVFLSPSPGRAVAEPMLILRSKQTFTERPQVRLLDAHTVAYHKSEEVLALLGLGVGDSALERQLARNSTSQIRIASKTNWMRMLAKQAGDSGPVMAFAPLWTKVDSVSLGINLSERLSLALQMDTTHPKKVSETLTAAKLLIRNYIEGISKSERQRGDDPTQMVMAAVAAQAGNQLLDSLEINTKANQLVLSAQLDNAVYPMIGLAVPAISSARTAARRSQSMNNLKQLLLAFHNYHSAHGHLPPAVVVDKETGVKRSWRIEVLPYLEYAELYKQYRKDQPWNSDANLIVLEQMPQVFAVAGVTGTTETPYQAIVSDDGGLTLSGDQEPRFRDFTDGLSNTVLLVETSKLVPWTKPVDMSEIAAAPTMGTSRSSDPGIVVGFADGSVRFLSEKIDPNIWRALTTRSGGEASSLN